MTYIPAQETSTSRTGAIKLHGPTAFDGMRKAGRVAAECLDMLTARVAPGITTSEIDDLVRDLNAEYEAAAAPYAIVSKDAGYQMVIRPQFAGLSHAFLGRVREARLSPTALEVLSIVAYDQQHRDNGDDESDRAGGCCDHFRRVALPEAQDGQACAQCRANGDRKRSGGQLTKYKQQPASRRDECYAEDLLYIYQPCPGPWDDIRHSRNSREPGW